LNKSNQKSQTQAAGHTSSQKMTTRFGFFNEIPATRGPFGGGGSADATAGGHGGGEDDAGGGKAAAVGGKAALPFHTGGALHKGKVRCVAL
jgi:hypothetical protein